MSSMLSLRSVIVAFSSSVRVIAEAHSTTLPAAFADVYTRQAKDNLFSCNDSVHGLELLEDSAYHCRLAQDSISGIKVHGDGSDEEI